jgi:hypothetical protein
MDITITKRSVIFLQRISCVFLVAGGDSDCVGDLLGKELLLFSQQANHGGCVN